ncbi:hypothetical protein SESBI_46463 [Sesbania bispinosa]|nr:hypothetical protein SESBI_46463 [Sesbania bispinosa]
MWVLKDPSGCSLPHDGYFIVLASVVTVLANNQWWYPTCKCNRAMIVVSDNYYCSICKTNIVEVSPRYKLKVEVFDGEDTTAFVMFDSDAELVTGISCDGVIDHLPAELEELGGREFLFKVEKAVDFAFKYDDTFKNKFAVQFPSLEDIPDDTTKNTVVDPAPSQDSDYEESTFCIASFLSNEAGCPVGGGSGDVEKPICIGGVNRRGKGKKVGSG